jgi:putative membrane protein
VCVDRDDDLGRKAGVRGPVVGRDAVLEAALKLGVVDPEDSDTNAMLAAVNVLDELRNDREEAEVVVLTGDGRVGTVSDRKVARQLDEVLARIKVEAVHLISDGQEDEYLYPLISSRVHVDSLRRVYVRQTASLQGTYYTIVRALKDQKLRTKTILPIAVLLFFIAFVTAFQVWSYGLIAFTLLLGAYLVAWTFDIDELLISGLQSVSAEMRRGPVRVLFGVMAFALAVTGVLVGYQAYASASPAFNVGVHILAFFSSALLWWLLAGAAWEAGGGLRAVLSKGKVPSSLWVTLVSLSAFGVESYSLLYFTSALLGYGTQLAGLAVVGILLGIALGVLAGTLNQYLRVRASAVAPERTPGTVG